MNNKNCIGCNTQLRLINTSARSDLCSKCAKEVIKSIPKSRLRKESVESILELLKNTGSVCICCGEELCIVESLERSDLCISCTMKLHHVPNKQHKAV